jgi:hypothetical protein
MREMTRVAVCAGLCAVVLGCTQAAPPAAGEGGAPGLAAPAAEAGRTTIGRWRDARPVVESTIEIARVGGRLTLEQRFTLDGSVFRVDLVEAGAPQGRRFDATGDAAGAYWVLTPEGALEVYDALGLVATTQPE